MNEKRYSEGVLPARDLLCMPPRLRQIALEIIPGRDPPGTEWREVARRLLVVCLIDLEVRKSNRWTYPDLAEAVQETLCELHMPCPARRVLLDIILPRLGVPSAH